MLTTSQTTYKKAIAYYRHSAEDKQENSVAIQRMHTEKFANENNIKIIHEEADEGKSGLLANRPAFERLFNNWVENPYAPDFAYVLVYDVSRWGRFQDQDQAGYFVHICKKHGKEVVYVSRGFVNSENQLFSSLEISLHRYMAAEYSRQLSEKVFYGCVKVSEQGYSAGGTAAYGMTRQLLDVEKKPIRTLKIGERKQIANERVTFTPKNDETTQTVKKIFQLFVEEKYLISNIVNYLNQNGTLSANGRRWDRSKVVKILTNEIYIGTHIYNKTWRRLKQKPHKNPRSEWIIVPNAFNIVVDYQIFEKAQERLYWLFSSNWRKGINAIKRANKTFKNDISKWLFNQGANEFEVNLILNKLPIIYAVKLGDRDFSFCCFLISEEIRKFENVLAVSVIPNHKNETPDFFFLSTNDFTKTDFLIFNENSSLYYKSKTDSSKIEEILKILINQLRNSLKRYKDHFQFIN